MIYDIILKGNSEIERLGKKANETLDYFITDEFKDMIEKSKNPNEFILNMITHYSNVIPVGLQFLGRIEKPKGSGKWFWITRVYYFNQIKDALPPPARQR